MTRSGRSVQDHDWCVWIYEADDILMPVIRLNLICTYRKSRLIRVLTGYRLGTDHLKSYGGGWEWGIFKHKKIVKKSCFVILRQRHGATTGGRRVWSSDRFKIR